LVFGVKYNNVENIFGIWGQIQYFKIFGIPNIIKSIWPNSDEGNKENWDEGNWL